MGYRNVNKILPKELVRQIQEFVDGEVIYIPRKSENHKCWGDDSGIRQELLMRNRKILEQYNSGVRVYELANEYSISIQGIYKILSKQRNM